MLILKNPLGVARAVLASECPMLAVSKVLHFPTKSLRPLEAGTMVWVQRQSWGARETLRMNVAEGDIADGALKSA